MVGSVTPSPDACARPDVHDVLQALGAYRLGALSGTWRSAYVLGRLRHKAGMQAAHAAAELALLRRGLAAAGVAS
jgi:hypothetical protein